MITCLNDILIPNLKGIFLLSYTEAMLIQFCFFGAYVLVSFPAGNLVRHIGYQRGIVAGLLIAGSGCLLFYPAAGYQQYRMFLGAMLILAGADAGAGMMESAKDSATTVQSPYLILAAALGLLAVFFSWLKLPGIPGHTAQWKGNVVGENRSIWSFRHLVLGRCHGGSFYRCGSYAQAESWQCAG